MNTLPAESPERIRIEARLIWLMGVIQFINILDFMMVMPLGPDFARALGIPAEHIGIIGGSYTLSAAFFGLVGSLFLDRFDRKKALLVALLGLSIATALGALAWNASSLLFARVLAGAFGGPLSSLCVSMIADHVPERRRGAAIGKAAGGFAAAAVLGVPFGLNLSLHFGWQAPFLAVGLGAAIIWVLGHRYLPANGNVRQCTLVSTQAAMLLSHMKRPEALAAFGYTMLATLTSFMIVPNISAHVQMNLGYPRSDLDLMYFFGGISSFFGMRYFGKLVDRSGATLASIISTALFVIAVFLGFIWTAHPIPFVLVMVLFMTGSSARNVCGNALASRVPPPEERGGFMSIISTTMHIGSASGAFFASLMLSQTPQHTLEGVQLIGTISALCACAVPLLFYVTEKHVRGKS